MTLLSETGSKHSSLLLLEQLGEHRNECEGNLNVKGTSTITVHERQLSICVVVKEEKDI